MEEIELEMIFEPTPKCPYCRDSYSIGKHLIKRRGLLGDMLYDCPECQATFREKEIKGDGDVGNKQNISR